MIKNECGHAYKLLDQAECLWCENCVEELVKRVSKKPEVTEEWIETYANMIDEDPHNMSKLTLTIMLKEVSVRCVA